ncbi:MAG: hypothetical protein JWQ74_2289 [Marmoricola sp.]|nr:hypothetical protein [Marmoricola sp.]
MHPRVKAIARPIVLAVNTPLAKVRGKAVYEKAPRPVKLEIGGNSPRAGWVVTNVGPTVRNYLDATVRWPFADGEVSHVYSDNVIEHITLDMGRAMYREAYRCLQPGGVMRLVTPDLRAHVELYLSGAGALDSPPAKHYLGMGLVVEHPIDLVRIPIASFGHHTGYLYDFETLAAELKAAGFTKVVQVKAGESEHPELNALDVRSHEGGAQLAVEATR